MLDSLNIIPIFFRFVKRKGEKFSDNFRSGGQKQLFSARFCVIIAKNDRKEAFPWTHPEIFAAH